MPDRFQHSRQKGAKLPEGCKLVTRATRWGNPFHVPDIMRAGYGNWSHPYPSGLWEAQFNWEGSLSRNGDTAAGQHYRAIRDELAVNHAVALFRALAVHFRSVDPQGFEDWIAPLRGHDLACTCPLHRPCHADVLLELARESENDQP